MSETGGVTVGAAVTMLKSSAELTSLVVGLSKSQVSACWVNVDAAKALKAGLRSKLEAVPKLNSPV